MSLINPKALDRTRAVDVPFAKQSGVAETDVQGAIAALRAQIVAAAAAAAPKTAQYLVGTSDATLTAERIVTDTATIAWDLATASQAKASVVDASISYAKFQDVAALSVVGRSANSSGVSAAITGTDGQVLRVSGTALGFGTIVAAGIAADAVITVKILDANVTYAKIQNVAALSVFGRSGNSSGVGADITGADGQALRVSGTTLGFGTLATAGHADASITYAKIQDVAGLSVVGRSANSSGVSAAITGTDGQALRVSGTALGFGTLATAGYADNSVTLAKVAQGTALSVLGVTGNAGANYADIAAASDSQVMRRSGTAVGFGAVDLTATNAVTGALRSGCFPTLTGAIVTAGATLATTATVDLVFVIGDNSNTITTGVKGYFPVDFGFTIVQWTLVADASGSIVVDIWSDTYANYPPTVADTITASAKPTISTATKGQSSSIGTWTSAGAVASGNVLGFNVDSITTCKQVTLTLKVTKTS